ncbi:MAG: hypothetical protein ACXVHX_22700 [Solirubrobacteraceae bacterium]
MAKFATAYIELRPDLSNFGTGLAKEIEGRLGGADVNEAVDRSFRPKFSGVGESLAKAIRSQTGPELERAAARAVQALDSVPKRKVSEIDVDIRQARAEIATVRADLADLGRQKATPEVKADTAEARLHLDEIQARLLRLKAERAEVTVDVDRSKIDALQSVGSSIGQALHGIAISLGGLLGIGGALTGLGQAAAAAAPLVVALAVGVGVLVASFGAAVAGAGALGIALAGALGPAAIVAFTALAKIAQVIKAIHTDSTKSAASTDAVAAAQDQLASSTDAVASAQANLKDQTVAAYRAWADSIEAVKDDLLAVQDAKLGIADASLSLREAKQALKEFKAEAPGLSGVFKKFTDVNVDMSGLKAALDAARKAGGNKLSTDDELKLERLILNVRRAKLGEKEATDRLHDANVKLQRDRQDEANYLAHGINAYPGYTSAVRGLAQANRSLAAAQRASATATAAQAGALAKLSPIQQRLATTFKLVSTGFNKALAPAMDALFSGLNRGLRIFLGVLSDPKIARALQEVGAAMGSVLVSMAKFFASKGARESFVALSRGAAQLIRVLGNKAFPAFFKILTAIAVASMPQLLKLANSIADTLDRWATWIDKHPKEFRDHLKKLIDTTFKWLAVLVEVGGFLLKLGGFFNGVGATIGRAFQGGKQAVSDFFANFGIHNDTLKALGDAFGALGKAAEYLWQKALPPLKGILSSVGQAFNGLVELVSGIVQGDWKKAWTGAKDIVVGALRNALNFIRLMLSPFSDIGKKLGKAFTSAFRTAVNAVKTVIRGIRDFFVSIISWVIDKVNELNVKIPKKVLGVPVPFVGGHHVGIHIDNPFADQSKPNLNPKHLPTLTKSPRGLRAATSSDQQPTIVKQFGDIVLPAPPAAAVPDARAAAVLFAREIQKR